MDQSLLAFISETMERIRTGDLGIGKVMGSERPLQEHLAQIAFLRGLIECLRLRDLSVVHYLLHEMIPVSFVSIFDSVGRSIGCNDAAANTFVTSYIFK